MPSPGNGSTYTSLPPVNLTTNVPGPNSNYTTWEITATKRDAGDRWSLLASFANTWNHVGLSALIPNTFINTDNGVEHYTNWQAKVNATLRLKWGVVMTPILRVQSGTPFARTFVVSTNYGSATVFSEDFGNERTANIALFDIRTEKQFHLRERIILTGFFDAYNIFNTNAEQAVTTSSGSAFLRPSSVTPPRIARVGLKFQF